MTGKELHELLVTKWMRSYGLQIRRVQGRIFLQVMWKYLEQASFPMSEADYFAHLDTIADCINAWGGEEQVKTYIEETRDHPRLGKAVNIPIEVGERASEWFLGDG